jgi:hypothetical protein
MLACLLHEGNEITPRTLLSAQPAASTRVWRRCWWVHLGNAMKTVDINGFSA